MGRGAGLLAAVVAGLLLHAACVADAQTQGRVLRPDVPQRRIHRVRRGSEGMELGQEGAGQPDPAALPRLLRQCAHTLGIAHCGTFGYRLMNDNDKGMDAAFRNSLRSQCNFNPNNVVPLDAGSQYAFDTSYYANVLANRTVLESDTALNSPQTVNRVRQLKSNPGLFMSSFATAMGRMGSIRGSNPGKVRVNCRKVRT